MSKFSLLKSLDSAIIDQLKTLKQNPEYQKFDDLYSDLEEGKQTAIKITGLAIFLLVPFILFLSIYLYSSSQEQKMNNYHQIYNLSQEILKQDENLKHPSVQVFGKHYDDQGSFQAALSQELQRNSIDSANVQISDFSSTEISDNLVELTTSLKISSFSNEQLFSFLDTLSIKMQARLEEIRITKDPKSNLINGIINITHLSQGLKN